MASNSYLDNSGLAYFLTKLASWIPSWFPSQTGQSGKVLTTDGSSLSWTAQSGGGVMVGATDSTDGESGLAPTPLKGEEKAYLRGDGTWQDSLDGRISNCLTQIPQDVKLELTGNTFTLKAGSKVYVPNGFEQDGTTKKFTAVTTTSDASQGRWGSATSSSIFVCYNPSSGSVFVGTSSDIVYDSTTNLCLQTSTNQCSLPIAVVTFNRGIITSVDQVFNGFGYIGSTVFVLPNVKGLIPDGRNADGTLKNIPFVCTSVITRELTGTGTKDFAIQEGGSTIRQNSGYVLNVEENLLYASGTVEKNCVFASGKTTNGKITAFTPKTTFHAVDINDKTFVRLVEAWRSSDGRLWYRKWSDGWIEQGGYHPSTGSWTDCAENLNTSFNTPFVNAKNTVQITMAGKGDLANPTNVTTTKFTIWIGDRLQATPVSDEFYWYACGY